MEYVPQPENDYEHLSGQYVLVKKHREDPHNPGLRQQVTLFAKVKQIDDEKFTVVYEENNSSEFDNTSETISPDDCVRNKSREIISTENLDKSGFIKLFAEQAGQWTSEGAHPIGDWSQNNK